MPGASLMPRRHHMTEAQHCWDDMTELEEVDEDVADEA